MCCVLCVIVLVIAQDFDFAWHHLQIELYSVSNNTVFVAVDRSQRT
jgi:hypothetical protein